MKQIVITYDVEENSTRENIERELRWYDIIRRELLIFKGGQLEFEYKEDPYLKTMSEEEKTKLGVVGNMRMLPVVKDLEVVNYNKTNIKTNEKDVRTWFNGYLNYNNSNIEISSQNKREIEFDIPDEEFDDFSYQIERRGFEWN